VILQISKEIDAIFFAFFLRVYILISESGKPMHPEKVDASVCAGFVGDIRMAKNLPAQRAKRGPSRIWNSPFTLCREVFFLFDKCLRFRWPAMASSD